jgi:peptidoglycan/LPS O-acetylase OafA/YrhL
LSTLLGNLAFVQTIAVPTYGTNGPLWSLANEFWYYVLFPLTWLTLVGPWKARACCAVLAAVLVWWLPLHILAAGLTWLFGYGAWWLSRQPRAARLLASPACLVALALACLGTLMASKTAHWAGSDYAIGTATAFLVAALASRTQVSAATSWASLALANMSYTLYLCHFPFLAFLWFVGVAPRQFEPGLAGYALFIAFVAATLAYAYLVWWCFERNTGAIRKWLEDRIG